MFLGMRYKMSYNFCAFLHIAPSHGGSTGSNLIVGDLGHAIREYRKIVGGKPLSWQGADYAHAIRQLNKAIGRKY